MLAITFDIPVRHVPIIIKESNYRSVSPITSKIVAKTQDTKPIVIIDRIPLKTNAFLVSSEQRNEEKYRAVMAPKYLICEILWKDLIKYGYIAITMSMYNVQRINIVAYT